MLAITQLVSNVMRCCQLEPLLLASGLPHSICLYLKPTLKMVDEADTLSFELNQSSSHRREPKAPYRSDSLAGSTEFLVAEV